jgi:hypothetical protein
LDLELVLCIGGNGSILTRYEILGIRYWVVGIGC